MDILLHVDGNPPVERTAVYRLAQKRQRLQAVQGERAADLVFSASLITPSVQLGKEHTRARARPKRPRRSDAAAALPELQELDQTVLRRRRRLG